MHADSPVTVLRASWWRMLVASMLLAVGVLVGGGGGPAFACSCEVPSLPERLDQLDDDDIAFLGTPVVVAPAAEFELTWSFDVESWLAGDVRSATVEVDAADGGASCGFEFDLEQPVAVFAFRDGERYTSGLCQVMSADSVRAALDPQPSRGGEAAFVVSGRYPDGSLAYLGADGDVLGVADIDGVGVDDARWPCADGRHLVEVGVDAIRVLDVVDREVATRVVTDLAQMTSIVDVDCPSADPASIRLLLEGDGLAFRERTLSALDGDAATYDVASRGSASLVDGGVIAVVGDDGGARVVWVAESGDQVTLLETHRGDADFAGFDSVRESPDGGQLIATEARYTDGGVRSVVHRVDLASGAIESTEPMEGTAAVLGWAGVDRVVIGLGGEESLMWALLLLDVETLDDVGRIDDWPAWTPAVSVAASSDAAGLEAIGVDGARVVRADFVDQTVSVVDQLPAEFSTNPMRLGAPVEVAPGAPRQPLATAASPDPITPAEISAREALSATSTSPETEPDSAEPDSAEPDGAGPSDDGGIPRVVVSILAVLAAGLTAVAIWLSRRRT